MAKKPKTKPSPIRDRVREIRRVKGSDLVPAPNNWRIHPDSQRKALNGVLREVGVADALKAWERPDGRLELIDGHLRAEELGDQEWPVLVLDVTEEEARYLLATHDPLGAMAQTDSEAFTRLMQEFETTDEAVNDLLIDLLSRTDAFIPTGEEEKHGWEKEWAGMPEYKQDDLEAKQQIAVHLKSDEDRILFEKAIDQELTEKTNSIWFPKMERMKLADKRWISHEPENPKYPVYIISKGRADTRLTSKSLEKMQVPYHIVIEPQEFDAYAEVIDPEKILVLPFSNLGQGSVPARNWVWEHSIAAGAERHWIVDDNINGFYRMNRNLKVPVASGAIFKAAEEFTDRYSNVGMSGLNYEMFAIRRDGSLPPYYLNTRIYSCILLRNDIPFRWRGRYNEDTDLSIRILKSGQCTILFNAFLAKKITTMIMKGGNTDELYQGDGRLKMAESLRDQHPDIVRVSFKWGRVQHHVDYRAFKKNELILKDKEAIYEGTNEFGMELVFLNE